jgi:hypothetical protein
MGRERSKRSERLRPTAAPQPRQRSRWRPPQAHQRAPSVSAPVRASAQRGPTRRQTDRSLGGFTPHELLAGFRGVGIGVRGDRRPGPSPRLDRSSRRRASPWDVVAGHDRVRPTRRPPRQCNLDHGGGAPRPRLAGHRRGGTLRDPDDGHPPPEERPRRVGLRSARIRGRSACGSTRRPLRLGGVGRGR